MTLAQLSAMKAWMVAHRTRRPVEYHACDLVLTSWVLGWMGAPASFMLHAPWALAACAGLYLVPPGYVRLRRWLHRHQRLRCDWLEAVQLASAR